MTGDYSINVESVGSEWNFEHLRFYGMMTASFTIFIILYNSMTVETQPLGRKLENFGRENDALRILLGQGLAWFKGKLEEDNKPYRDAKFKGEMVQPDFETQAKRLEAMAAALESGFDGYVFESEMSLGGRDNDSVKLCYYPQDRVDSTGRPEVENGPVDYVEIVITKRPRHSPFTIDPHDVVMSGGYRIEMRTTQIYIHPRLEELRISRQIGLAVYTNLEGKCEGEGLNYTGFSQFRTNETLQIDRNLELAPLVQEFNTRINDFQVF